MSDFSNVNEQALEYFRENPDACGRPRPNEDGTEYVWDALGGRVAQGRMVNKISLESSEFWFMAREDWDARDTSLNNNYYRFHPKDEFGSPDDCYDARNIEGEHAGDTAVVVSGDKFSMVVAEGHEQDAKQFVNECTEVIHDSAKIMRGMKSDDPDKKTAELIDRSAERIAKWADDYADIMGNEHGNFALAEGRSATLTQTVVKCGSLPKLSVNKELSACENYKDRVNYMHRFMDNTIRTMHQLEKPEGERISIFDDYMDIMDGGNSEIRVEYHRQHMEETGWDANKDAIYQAELKASHEKIIKAFENLCKIEDADYYKNVLNNDLPEMTGNKPSRDFSPEVGYMRGENQAIDLGYPSDQMFALGELGATEGIIERNIRQKETSLRNENNPEQKQKLEEEKQKLSDAMEELSGIKQELWGRKYQSPEDTLEVYHRQNEFVDKHPEFRFLRNGDTFRKARELNTLADKTADLKAISAAMGDFNAKRTDKWFSSESTPHKNLRESAERLQREVKAYKTGIYQEGDKKGKKMSEEERIALREAIERRADEVSRNADTYLGKRKGERSTEAGNRRKAGAEALRAAADSIRESIAADRSRDVEYQEALAAQRGYDRELNRNMQQALNTPEDRAMSEVEYRNAWHSNKIQDKDRMIHVFDQIYKEYRENPYDDENLANVIAAKSLSMAVKNGKMKPLDAINNVDSMSDQIFKTDGFKTVRTTSLKDMEPGEIYAKWALAEQDAKYKKVEASKAKAIQAQKQVQRPQPKAPQQG